jgi:aspartyl-tRNA(Asn)/glutamyl-tRNA(Gln) amidotransferase subunit C
MPQMLDEMLILPVHLSPMSEISRDEVLQIAALAKLKLTEDEISSLQEQLGRILEHFRAIESVDTSSVEPMRHVLEGENIFREDIARESISQEDALKNAPSANKGFFEVPKVIDKG